MGRRGRMKRLEREARKHMIVFELEDGTEARFYEPDFAECFVHETARLRRHSGGDEPGASHPLVEALRRAREGELERLMSEHGTILAHMVGEDQIIRGERERLGTPVVETSPGVYE